MTSPSFCCYFLICFTVSWKALLAWVCLSACTQIWKGDGGGEGEEKKALAAIETCANVPFCVTPEFYASTV